MVKVSKNLLLWNFQLPCLKGEISMKKFCIVLLSVLLLLCSCDTQTNDMDKGNTSKVNSENENLSVQESFSGESSCIDDMTASTASDNGSSSVSKPSNEGSVSDDDSSSVSKPSNEEDSNISVTYNNSDFILDDSFNEMISSGEWITGTTDCAYDFVIQLGEKTFYYHSECGTFVCANKSKKLNDLDKASLNDALFMLVGISQNDVANPKATRESSNVENEPNSVTFSESQQEKLTKLLADAGESAILVAASGHKTVVSDDVADRLLDNMDSFVETSEGHLYDGIIEVWLVYGDGTVLGMYTNPMTNVPDIYSSCVGRLYGAQYHFDKDGYTVVDVTYGYLPIAANELPLEQIDSYLE